MLKNISDYLSMMTLLFSVDISILSALPTSKKVMFISGYVSELSLVLFPQENRDVPINSTADRIAVILRGKDILSSSLLI